MNLDRAPINEKSMRDADPSIILERELIVESGKNPNEWIEEYAQKYRDVLSVILTEDPKVFDDMEAAEEKIKERLYH
jgi:hypothetical protein